MNKRIKKLKKAGHQWLTPIILATEIGKINLLGREFLQDPMSTEKGWACGAYLLMYLIIFVNWP
jgi:hypothetical protein